MLILLIDKTMELATQAKTFLESFGYRVACEVTTKNGIQLIQKFDPDIVILGGLYHMDCLNTCQKIRNFSDVPILVVSSKEDDTNILIQALEHGADDIQSHPIDISFLKAKIEAVLR